MLNIFRLLVFVLIALPACNCKVGDVSCVENSVENIKTIFGKITLTDKSCSTLNVYGKAVLNRVNISEKLSVSGSVSATDSKINYISVSGKVELQKTSVSDKVSVSGSVKASDSTIQSFSVSGKVNLRKTIVSAPSEISGCIIAEDSTLDKIVINAYDSSSKIIFSDSKAKTINVISKPAEQKERLVELNNTKIDGDIIFEGKKGKVILRGNSEITGKIVGGAFEKL